MSYDTDMICLSCNHKGQNWEFMLFGQCPNCGSKKYRKIEEQKHNPSINPMQGKQNRPEN